MLQVLLSRCLNHIHKTGEITLHVEMRIFQRVSHPGLRCQVYDQSELFILENIGNGIQVCDVGVNELEAWVIFQDLQPRMFQAFIVKAVEVIDSDDLMTRLQKPLRDMESNKSGVASEQYPFHTETSLFKDKTKIQCQKIFKKLPPHLPIPARHVNENKRLPMNLLCAFDPWSGQAKIHPASCAGAVGLRCGRVRHSAACWKAACRWSTMCLPQPEAGSI